jgi:hypothetical protein
MRQYVFPEFPSGRVPDLAGSCSFCAYSVLRVLMSQVFCRANVLDLYTMCERFVSRRQP